ncbi:hypothetical protein C8Q70DRAFT_1095252 [Cubamyces menziesii]|nr:hypothetical protein C8Q70DRAFT_1095252 [Cubamyces menziesii]
MPDSISVNNTFIFIADDGDLQSISYGGLWEHDTNRTGYVNAYEDTGSIGTLGATATMQFSGFAVFAFAALPSPLGADLAHTAALLASGALLAPNVTVSLDTQAPTRVSIPLPTDSDAAQDPIPFYTQTALAQDRGPHTLRITVDADTPEFPFVLDAIGYASAVPTPTGGGGGGGAAASTPTAPGSQQIVSGSAAAGQGGFIGGFWSELSGAQQGGGKPGAELPVAAIVGGVVGGVTLLLAAGLALYFLCVRARHLKLQEAYFMQSAMVAEPFKYEDKAPLMEAYDSASAPPPNSDKERSSSYPSQASYHAPPSHAASTSSSNLLAEPLLLRASSSSHSLSESQSASHYSHPASISRSSSSGPLSEGARRKAEEAGILSVPGRPPAATTYHTDSGVRFVALNADAVDPTESHAEGSGSGIGPAPADVPPSYTAS